MNSLFLALAPEIFLELSPFKKISRLKNDKKWNKEKCISFEFPV